MDHGGMDMGSGSSSASGAACKISMMWNWNTIDSCFISSGWHVRSKGAFAGTVIGVFLIVVALEAVRRLSRDYDRTIKRAYYGANSVRDADGNMKNCAVKPFRPTTGQHAVRSLMYFVQFSTSYMLMLLAMYYNGYIVFAIFFGGGVGFFLFNRDTAEEFEVVGRSGECC